MANNSVVYIAIVTGSPAAKVIQDRYLGNTNGRYDGDENHRIEGIRRLLEDVASGLEPGKVYVAQDAADGTAATSTIACVQASISSGDYVKVGDVKFTAKTSPSSAPGAGEFAFLTSDTVTGAALAAAINAHPATKNLYTAVNASGTVTLTTKHKGPQGNWLKLTKSGAGFTVTSPTNGALGTMQYGLRSYGRGS